MTDQRRGGSPRGDEPPAPGYRGSLPPRDDALAKPWVLVVAATFVLIFVLAFANVPSAIFPSPTPLPSISAAPSGSAAASPSAGTSASASASASPSP